ncbi:MAG: hypothetical protein WCO06_07675, partial [Candidatus Roizmanbacteria bacterium]
NKIIDIKCSWSKNTFPIFNRQDKNNKRNFRNMKTVKKVNAESPVEQLREIRDSISSEIQDMTFEQLKKYIDAQLTIHSKSGLILFLMCWVYLCNHNIGL